MNIIYGVYDTNNTCVYIGRSNKTLESRRRQHYYKCFIRQTRSPNRLFYVKWRMQIVPDDFTFKLIESNVNNEDVKKREQYFISYYKPMYNSRNEIRQDKCKPHNV